MDSFPTAVLKTIGEGVPCARPYRYIDIQLLQLIQHGHVDGYGLFRHKPVLMDPGDGGDTLIYFVKQHGQQGTLINGDGIQGTLIDDVDDFDKIGEHNIEAIVVTKPERQRDLEKLVLYPEEAKFDIKQMNKKQRAAIKAGFHTSISLQDGDLAKVGFKPTRDRTWSLSFGDDRITKKSVSPTKLESILTKHKIPWRKVLRNFIGVVTDIYYVTGGLKYTGDSESVTINAEKLDPTEKPVEIKDTEGWKYTVNNVGQVVLSEINPCDWIIAIDYQELE